MLLARSRGGNEESSCGVTDGVDNNNVDSEDAGDICNDDGSDNDDDAGGSGRTDVDIGVGDTELIGA